MAFELVRADKVTRKDSPGAGKESPQPPGSSRRGEGITRRRLLGAFYTPDDLALALTSWALRDGPGPVLDPSYGGCAFLRAAVTTLEEHGVASPGNLVFGVDVDKKCVRYAEGLIAKRNYHAADFLGLTPSAFGGALFKAVVGNPPYVRHHWLKGARRRAARSAAVASGADLPDTASTWAYFVAHATAFLLPEGRLALLVPEAILQADYARGIRDLLVQRFARTRLIHIRERVFGDTDEPVVIVAAEGKGPGTLQVLAVESADNLDTVLAEDQSTAEHSETVISNGRAIESDVLDLVDETSQHAKVRRLGDLATIRIGFVTGANHFFVRSRADAKALAIPREALVPVVARTQWLKGIQFTKDDHKALADAGRRTLLVRPTPAYSNSEGVKAWIAQGLTEKLDERHKCSVRPDWYRVQPGPAPDAFATCSRLGSPLLIINDAHAPCTNALHALTWKAPLPIAADSIAVSFLCSLTSLWAEIHGRRYGGGVLKLEPGTLRQIPVPIISTSLAARIDKLLRTGREAEARLHADEIVLHGGLGLTEHQIRRLQEAQRLLATQRLPTRRPQAHGNPRSAPQSRSGE